MTEEVQAVTKKAGRPPKRPTMNHLAQPETLEVGGMTFSRTNLIFDYGREKKLDIPQDLLDPDLRYRWINDTNGKVLAAKERGYAQVDLSQHGIKTVRRVGTDKHTGLAIDAYLMATPKKWYEERQNAQEEIRKNRMRAAFRKPLDESGAPLGSEFYNHGSVSRDD